MQNSAGCKMQNATLLYHPPLPDSLRPREREHEPHRAQDGRDADELGEHTRADAAEPEAADRPVPEEAVALSRVPVIGGDHRCGAPQRSVLRRRTPRSLRRPLAAAPGRHRRPPPGFPLLCSAGIFQIF